MSDDLTQELDLWGDPSFRPISASRMRVCRMALGRGARDLADELKVTPAAIHHWEAGTRQPVNNFRSLCDALEVSPEGLASSVTDPPSSGPFFRSLLKDASERLREQTTSYCRLVADVATYFDRRVGIRKTPTLVLTGSRNPEEVAQEARRALALPDGPVVNMVRCAEAAGAIAVFGIRPVTLGVKQSTSVNAYSTVAGGWPIIVMTPKGDYYRQRRDVAHELGHLLLHGDQFGADDAMEDEADRFAAEFLTPAAAILKELPSGAAQPRKTIERLSSLKEEWGVSMESLIYSAHDLHRIGETTKSRLLHAMHERGWTSHEPGQMQSLEMPTVLPGALQTYMDYGISRELMKRESGVPSTLFDAIISRHALDLPPVFDLH